MLKIDDLKIAELLQNVVCCGECSNKVVKTVLASHAALIQLLFHSHCSYLCMSQTFLLHWRNTFWSSKGHFWRKKCYPNSLDTRQGPLFITNQTFFREISAARLLFCFYQIRTKTILFFWEIEKQHVDSFPFYYKWSMKKKSWYFAQITIKMISNFFFSLKRESISWLLVSFFWKMGLFYQ